MEYTCTSNNHVLSLTGMNRHGGVVVVVVVVTPVYMPVNVYCRLDFIHLRFVSISDWAESSAI